VKRTEIPPTTGVGAKHFHFLKFNVANSPWYAGKSKIKEQNYKLKCKRGKTTVF